MAKTRTLAQMRTEARQRADMVNSTFVSDAEVDRWINQGIGVVYDKLVRSKGMEYYATDTSFNTVAGQQTYSISSDIGVSDFYKLVAIDASIGGTVFTLTKLNFQAERNLYQNTAGWFRHFFATKYALIGGERLRFYPKPSGAHAVTFWYIPSYTTLALDADTFDGINGWEDYAIGWAARRMLIKEESDIRPIEMELRDMEKRIEDLANDVDFGQADTIGDIDRIVDSDY